MEINATSSLSSHTAALISSDNTASTSIGLFSSINPTETLPENSFPFSASNNVFDGPSLTGSILSNSSDILSSSYSTVTSDSEIFTDRASYSSVSGNGIGSKLGSFDTALYSSLSSGDPVRNTLLSSTGSFFKRYIATSPISSDALTSHADSSLPITQTSNGNSLFVDITKSVTLEPNLISSTINASYTAVSDGESYISIHPSVTVLDSSVTPTGDFATSTVSFNDASLIHNDDWTSDGIFNSNSTLNLDNTSLFTTYEEYSDDITIVIGIFVPLVVVALLVAAFVCYAKYWKKRGYKRRNEGRAKVSFSDNPVVSGSVLAPRYSDAEGCTTNVFADLPDKKDGFVTIDLSEDGQATNGGLNIASKNSGQKNDSSNQNLEIICEKEELCFSDEEHNEDTETKASSDIILKNGSENLEIGNTCTDDVQNNSYVVNSDSPANLDENVHYDNNINLFSDRLLEKDTENSELVNGNDLNTEASGTEEITKL